MQQDQLLELLQKKDEKSFDHLYDMYAQSLFGVIHAIVKNKAQAEDVLQEVMVKIWQKIDTYDASKGRFYTYGSLILLAMQPLINTDLKLIKKKEKT